MLESRDVEGVILLLKLHDLISFTGKAPYAQRELCASIYIGKWKSSDPCNNQMGI